ncbi:MAG: AAA family ATPase [Caldilineaceae bacterium]|nr:AAA family ATPase [Caldilineaceae bacterium]
MADRQEVRQQIAAETEHILPDPVAAAINALRAAIEDGKDDPDAGAILLEALTVDLGPDAPARSGADIAEGLRSESLASQEQAREEIRKLLDLRPVLTDILTKHDPNPLPVSWLVDGWMPDATLSVLTGAGGAGKSRIALQLAVAVAIGGKQFFWPKNGAEQAGDQERLRVLESGPVVFAAWETRKLAWQNRLAAICGNFEDEIDKLKDKLHYINMRPEGGLWGVERGAHTSTAGNWLHGGTALLSYAARVEARLLIIDPLAAAFVQNENDRALVRAFLSALDQWAEGHNCAVLIISHPPKSDSAQSGSTDWRNGVQAVWKLETTMVKEENGKEIPSPGGERVLKVDKLNEGSIPDHVYLSFEDGRFIEVEKPTFLTGAANNGKSKNTETNTNNGK